MGTQEEFVSTFIEDAEEIVQSLFDTLMILDEEPGNEEKINELFRLVHTVKGAAALIGLDEISNYAHEIESLLDGLRKGRLAFSEDLSDVLFSSFNILKVLVEDLKSGRKGERCKKIDDMVELLRIAGGRSRSTDNLVEEIDREPETPSHDKGQMEREESDKEDGDYSEISPELFKLSRDEKAYIGNLLPSNRLYYIRYSIPDDIAMPLSRALMLYRAIEEETMIIRSFPPVEYMEEEFRGYVDLIVLTDKDKKEIREIVNIEGVQLKFIKEVELDEIERIIFDFTSGEDSESSESDITTEHRMENKEDGGGEESLESTRTESQDVDAHDRAKNIAEFSKRIVKETIRVDVEKLDRLMNLVGELVINRTRNQDIVERLKQKYGADSEIDVLNDSIQEEGRIIYELQESIMESRMVPIGLVFKRFPMFVRNMAKKGNKRINLVIEGADTELDKKLVDGISEPLIHLVRNAVDHGIEPVDERVALGKPEEGTIRIKAYHAYNQIAIEIEDDGRGIDLDLVVQKGIEKGMVTRAEAEELTRKEKIELIFQPGLSTAKMVTENSGRGVGMDAVKRKIEAMNGSMEIVSERNRGTKIFIKLPLTLAIIKALLVDFGRGIYAIPIDDIVEIIKVSASEFYRDSSGGMLLDLREEIIPLHYIEELFGLPVSGIKENYYVIIIKRFDRKEGVIVGELRGEKEIVIKSLSGMLLNLPGIAGASIMGDGTVVPIVDIQELLQNAGVSGVHSKNAVV